MFYASYPVTGGSVVTIYANMAAFPASATTGSLAVDASTGNLYEFNGTSWVLIAGPGAALALGNLDSQSPTAQGAALVGGVLSMQSADATHPGLVNNTTQAFSGAKTFNSGLTGTLTGSASLNILLTEKGTNNGVATLDSAGHVPLSQLPPSLIEYQGTWDASTNTPTLSNSSGIYNVSGYFFIVSVAGTVNFGAGAISFNSGDWVLYNGTVWERAVQSNVVQSVNGQTGIVNVGTVTTVGSFDAHVSANAATITGANIDFQSASASNPGMVNTGSQSFAGAKTFTGAISASNLTGTNSGDITLGTTNGLTLTGQALSLGLSSTSTTGALSSTDWNTFNSKGVGTVTAVSVASINGFAGTSSGGTTPALTLSTSITGVLKGNGTAISAATQGTDYSAGTSGLATGILKSTTTTGALTIAVAGDFPTLNQSTTGNAATATSATTALTANSATSATTAINIGGGSGGSIPYQSAASTTVLLANGTAGQFLASAGGTSAPAWTTFKAPTAQVFLTGSGNYTTPAGVLYIIVELQGGGGGGGATGAGNGAAGPGGATTFGASGLSAGGGARGVGSTGQGGLGGTNTASVGTILANSPGSAGQGSSTATLTGGGQGGASYYGGQGGGSNVTTDGVGAPANTGGGGGGGGGSGAAAPGAGGGAGGFIRTMIAPTAGQVFAYSVGAAGTGGTTGTSGQNGGSGASGKVTVTEFYS